MLSKGEKIDLDDGETVLPENLLLDFDGVRDAEGYPEGWGPFRGREIIDENVFFEQDSATDRWQLRFEKGATRDIGVISDPIPVEPKAEYTVYIDALTLEGPVRFFLRFFDADDNQLGDASVNKTPTGWETLTATRIAPDNAAYARLILFAEGDRAIKTIYQNPRLYKK